MVIFWAITPLQGAVFGTGPVPLKSPGSFSVSSDLLPPQQQSYLLDTSVLHRLYATKYLGQEYPSFATPEYALRPFKLNTASSSPSINPNWTATTTKFWSDLECWPAEAIESELYPGYYDFLNGKGCNASEIMAFRTANAIGMSYISWYNSPYSDQFLSRSTCTSEFSNHFLAIAARREVDGQERYNSSDFTMTALFCEASYWKQKVEVTVPSDTLRPVDASILPVGPVEELTGEEFNNTGFEYLIGSSVSAVHDVPRDYPSNLIIDQYSKVNDTGLNWPLSPLIGFVIGGRERPIDDYLDATVLAEGFRAVHKAVFVHAYTALLSEAEASEETFDGSIEFVLYGILVSRVLSAVVEALLLAVSTGTVILAIIASRTESNLIGDPSTLGDVIDLLQASPDLLDAAISYGEYTEEEARRDMEATRVYLRHSCHDRTGKMAIMMVNPEGSPRALLGPGATRNLEADNYTPVKPFVLRRTFGSLLVSVTLSCLAVLAYFRFEEQRLGGKGPIQRARFHLSN